MNGTHASVTTVIQGGGTQNTFCDPGGHSRTSLRLTQYSRIICE